AEYEEVRNRVCEGNRHHGDGECHDYRNREQAPVAADRENGFVLLERGKRGTQQIALHVRTKAEREHECERDEKKESHPDDRREVQNPERCAARAHESLPTPSPTPSPSPACGRG